jgi:hypothetical protein
MMEGGRVMAVTKHKKNQASVRQSATKTSASKKVVVLKTTVPKKSVSKKISAVRETSPKKSVKQVEVPQKTAAPLQKKVIPVSAKPSAQTCPLVLDGLIAPEAFSPRDCFSCDEFDCRFYTDEERSGPLGSRLFVSDEEGEEDADLLGSDRGEDDSDPWDDEDE